MPPDAKELIEALVCTEPSKRLGSADMGGGRTLRESKFFKPIDFLRLVRKEYEAPWVPKIESATDTRHSPDESELDLPDEGKPIYFDDDGKDVTTFFPEFESLDEGEEWDLRGGVIKHDIPPPPVPPPQPEPLPVSSPPPEPPAEVDTEGDTAGAEMASPAPITPSTVLAEVEVPE